MKKIVPCGLHCIKLIDLGVNYGEQVVLENINIHVHCGSLTAVIGRNGAGKSTLVRAILGEIPYSGEIQFRDKMNDSMGKMKIGYVPQTINIDRNTPMSVYDLFESFVGKKPILFFSKKEYQKVKQALAEFDVADLIDQSVGTLSGGQLQRVLLAMAVHDTPNLLILDEPVSGIDKNGMDLFYEKMKYLKETHDLAIIVVSHDLDYVYKYADNVLLIDKTITAAGNPKQVFETEAFYDTFGEVSFTKNSEKKHEKVEKSEEIQEATKTSEKTSGSVTTSEKTRENMEISKKACKNEGIGLHEPYNPFYKGKEVKDE